MSKIKKTTISAKDFIALLLKERDRELAANFSMIRAETEAQTSKAKSATKVLKRSEFIAILNTKREDAVNQTREKNGIDGERFKVGPLWHGAGQHVQVEKDVFSKCVVEKVASPDEKYLILNYKEDTKTKVKTSFSVDGEAKTKAEVLPLIESAKERTLRTLSALASKEALNIESVQTVVNKLRKSKLKESLEAWLNSPTKTKSNFIQLLDTHKGEAEGVGTRTYKFSSIKECAYRGKHYVLQHN